MALYALDDVDDAYAVTRAFLTSIDRTTWLKLALIVFFVGGAGANFPGTSFSGANGGEPGAPPAEEFPAFDPGPDFWLLVGAVVLVLVALALALFFVAAVMEFVFVESLRTEDVSIREYWGRYWRKGLRLFGFRLVVGLLFLAPFLAVMALFFAPVALGTGGFAAPVLALVVLLPVVFVLAIVVGLVDSFTTNFVVPIMLLEDRGVVDGWRRLWPTIKSQWKQYLAYAVAAWILSLVGGVLIAVVAGILVAVLFVPFGILLAVGIGLLSVLEPVGIAWLVVTGLLFALAALVVALLVTVPVQTYLRYYALLVLGDVDADLDIIPEQRAAVRSDVESGGDGDAL
ncbi:hypothetical protein SAMN05216559_0578 [Halomicrobium zhouii]|uniref:Membrane domain of glycerophosphoryl diester phosphodiesterase n=1 Tax=Halomicrobium zhouii TaxID=767519 RepID=A0A1I6KD41_9EURY|nr:hypothetical protein [Halomicrobium zhouii]SFR89106.1 hypothetical protein SAMN05216559_0578 [Halomicrobium zhouii]